MSRVTIDSMLGAVLTSVEVNKTNDEVTFIAADGRRWLMNHYQDL